MGFVDRHKHFMKGTLKLAKTWKTKRWKTRIQLELLGMTMVDAFLAIDDSDSIFWQFVCAVIGQMTVGPRLIELGKVKMKILHCIANMFLWVNTKFKLVPTKGV